MTTGALIFARNNEEIDYVAMAEWSARRIERHLGIPTHIVTDSADYETNIRWFSDYNKNITWHNQSRVTAYEASPWDRTLVLDADYVVASDQLLTVLNSAHSFLCFRQAFDVTGLDDFVGHNTFGTVRMPMWWATVMCFDRSEHSRSGLSNRGIPSGYAQPQAAASDCAEQGRTASEHGGAGEESH
jgi:hypothetical protein